MAKKKRKSSVFYQMYDNQVELSSGAIILRPEIRIYGPFDVCFARLFRAYAWHLFRRFCDEQLMEYLPQPDQDPVALPIEEVTTDG